MQALEATADFTSDEVAILNSLDIPAEPQAPEQDPVQTAEGDAKDGAQQVENIEKQAAEPAAQQVEEPAAQPSPQAAQEAAPKQQGDPRAALRAARRAEHRAREQLVRVTKERDELLARVPADQRPDNGEITDQEIEAAARDFPVVGKAVRFIKQAQAAQAAAKPAAEFVPDALPLEVQNAVDDTPELEAWQRDPDQTRFTRAKAVDAQLAENPAWSGKSLEERFKEVVRLVNQEAAAPPARRDPAQVLEAVPRKSPETLSHIGGGGGKQPEAPALNRYMAMSDDAIVADLMREG